MFIVKMQEIVKTQKMNNNPINKNSKCFKYASTAVLHHEEILNNPKRLIMLKLLGRN